MKKNDKTKGDFLVSDLPKNRREQFFDLLKNNYWVLFKTGLIMLLFALPFFAMLIFRSILIHGSGDPNTIIAIQLIFYAANIITSMIFSLGLAGAIKIIKRLVWNEPIFYAHDIFEGIKENIVFFLTAAFIISLTYALSQIVILFNVGGQYLMYLPKVIFLIFVCPLFLEALSFSFIYKCKIITALKAGLIFGIKCYPSAIISSSIFSIFLLLNLIPYIFIKLGIIILVMLFLFPIFLLGIFANQMRLYDKHFNPQNYPELVGIGLYKEDK